MKSIWRERENLARRTALGGVRPRHTVLSTAQLRWRRDVEGALARPGLRARVPELPEAKRFAVKACGGER
jgi:hypothetical protein